MRYLPLEKAILVVMLDTRKLPHYFQAHIVVILTQLLLKTILRNVNYIRRIAKWGTILGVFDIKYMPRTFIKGQILVDLVAEFTEPEIEELPLGGNMDEKLVGTISQYCLPTWEVYVDGASNQKGSRVGLVLMSPEKVVIEKTLRLDFSTTNNDVEYETLLEGMAMVQRMGGKSIKLFSDSRLVVGQVKGEFEAKNERLQGYLSQVKCLQLNFDSFDLLHVPRSSNAHADFLAMLVTSSAQDLSRVIIVEDIYKPARIGETAQIN